MSSACNPAAQGQLNQNTDSEAFQLKLRRPLMFLQAHLYRLLKLTVEVISP